MQKDKAIKVVIIVVALVVLIHVLLLIGLFFTIWIYIDLTKPKHFKETIKPATMSTSPTFNPSNSLAVDQQVQQFQQKFQDIMKAFSATAPQSVNPQTQSPTYMHPAVSPSVNAK